VTRMSSASKEISSIILQIKLNLRFVLCFHFVEKEFFVWILNVEVGVGLI